MDELVIPVTLFLSVAGVSALGLYYRYRARSEVQQTLRASIERGHELTPELLKLLGNPPRQPQADFRRGIVGLAMGVGFALFGLILGEEDALQPLLGLAVFPAVIGVAYLLLWKLGTASD